MLFFVNITNLSCVYIQNLNNSTSLKVTYLLFFLIKSFLVDIVFFLFDSNLGYAFS
ncbi:hypothetical protein GWE_00195 [Chlamydia psittaci NJ1]|nr:hypothetical protein GWE_00195 [Chlamydia psittaci NJ1]